MVAMANEQRIRELIRKASAVAAKHGIRVPDDKATFAEWMDHFCTAADGALALGGKDKGKPASKDEKLQKAMFKSGSSGGNTPAYMMSTKGLSASDARIFTRERDAYLARGQVGFAKLKDLGCGQRSLDRLSAMLKGTRFRMSTSEGEPGDTLGAVSAIEEAVALLSDGETRQAMKLIPWAPHGQDDDRLQQVAEEQLANTGAGWQPPARPAGAPAGQLPAILPVK